MIISASRRTDIPSYYAEWFFNRIREEYVLVRNPMNIHQVGKIRLSSDVVDGIVLWTKNPIPMIKRISELDKYSYYFQFTLTSYGKDVEPDIPSKNKEIIPVYGDTTLYLLTKHTPWNITANTLGFLHQNWGTIQKNAQ